ncbi:MAG: hypothetical protein MHM6MM_003755 [Cercozoa sp. M6MM]
MFDVQVVPAGLSPQETVLQLVESLAQLHRATEGVFGRVEKRVRREQRKLRQLQRRVENVEQRVSQIREQEARATVLFSQSRFPETSAHSGRFECLSKCDSKDGKKRTESSPLVLPPDSAEARERHEAPRDASDTTALVRRLNQAVLEDTRRVNTNTHGLGAVPRELHSAQQLLLFNTATNPYERYAALDNLVADQGSVTVEEDEEYAVSDAPHTLVHGENLPAAQTELAFKPQFTGVVTPDLPSVMPGLPGVVDQAQVAEATSIAPSLAPLASVLPTFGDAAMGGDFESMVSQFTLPVFDTEDTAQDKVATAAAEPVVIEETGVTEADMAIDTDGLASGTDADSDVSDGDDDRNSLLAAIRMAGKNKHKTLRPSQQQEQDNEAEEEATAPEEDTSIMSALRAALRNRQAALSGRPVDTGSSSGGIEFPSHALAMQQNYASGADESVCEDVDWD